MRVRAAAAGVRSSPTTSSRFSPIPGDHSPARGARPNRAFAEPDRVLLSRSRWPDESETARAALPPPGVPRRATVPIRRRPWRDTFAGDLSARLGARNVYADHAERYPRTSLDELNATGADLVVLPDEPYRFTATDSPEAFPAMPAALVDGRYLTWSGRSPAGAPAALRAALR